MIDIRPFAGLGHADHGWLNAWHSFSFAGYYDRAHTGFRSLRVINDDTVAPGGGFGTHPHRDMEIITFVRSGAITHQDSLGNKGRDDLGFASWPSGDSTSFSALGFGLAAGSASALTWPLARS